MTVPIDRDKIIAFILDTLPLEEVSFVVDSILSNENLKKIYEEEKSKILTHCYVDNELSPYDRIEFEGKLKKDKQLLKEVNLQKEINNSLENLVFEETLEEAYESYISPKEHSIPSTTRTYSINRKLKNWLAAASITILLILGGGITYHFQTGDSLENRLYATHYEPLDNNATGLFIKNSSLNEAKQKYLEGDYTIAWLLYENLPNSLVIETEKQFYSGLILMELNRYDEAIIKLKELPENNESKAILSVAEWYLGLCYLKTKQNSEAIKIFEDIVNENGYNYKKAKRIIVRFN